MKNLTICKKCDEQCDPSAGCRGGDNTDCNLCKNYTYTSPDTKEVDCLENCPAETYSLNNNTCQRCPVTNCLACQLDESQEKPAIKDIESCQAKCPGFYRDISYVSQSRIVKCNTCTPTQYLISYDKEEEITGCTCCVNQCPQGYTQKTDSSKKQCIRQYWCTSTYSVCFIAIPVILSVVGFIFLLVVVICCCKRCKKKDSSSTTKTPPPDPRELDNIRSSPTFNHHQEVCHFITCY